MCWRAGGRAVLLLLPVSLSLSVLAGAAEMYRWVDKDGRVHFSDKPPPAEARDSSKLVVPESTNAVATDGEGSVDDQLTRTQQAAEAMRADRLARQQQKAESNAERAKRQKACSDARAELNRFETANIKLTVNADNSRREMTDAEHETFTRQLRDAVEKACR